MADIDSTSSADIELKKRARRRLVGAAALALLAAIVLPMVMDQQPRQPAQDIQVKIPAEDAGGFTSRILPAKPTAMPLPQAETTAPPAGVARPESTPADAVRPAVAEKPVGASAPSEPAAKPADKPAAPVAEKPVAKPADKPVLKPAEKPEAAKSDQARAAAALAGQAGGEQWVIQLGAFKDPGNVRQLVAKMKELGVASYTEPFESPQGARTRVRAGPFKSREAAEGAQARLKRIGIDGSLAPK